MKNTGKDRKNFRIKHTQGVCEFIVKLIEIMHNYPKLVYWSEDGNSLKFKDINELQKTVMPAYFRHSNRLSFIRQLNMYYFSKVESNDRDEMVFDHTIFRRGNEENYYLIQRRNGSRDKAIELMKEKFEDTLDIIQTDPKLRPQTKKMLIAAIQYHQISLDNIKKINEVVLSLSNQLRGVRTKEVKNAIINLKNNSVPALEVIQNDLNKMDAFIKEELCRDLGIMQTHTYQPISSQRNIFLAGQSVKQIPYLVNNQRSEDSLRICKSEGNLKEQIEISDEVSLAQQLEQQD